VLLGVGTSLLLLIVGLAVFIPVPSAFQRSVFRTALALGVSCVAASIPWFVGNPAGAVQTAGVVGGALGVFLLVFLFDPVGRTQRAGAGVAPVVALGDVAERCIFISYRRVETEDVVGRLYERLVAHFGAGAVFKDIDAITPGLDFREELTHGLRQCRVVIAVIGRDWEQLRNENNVRKLDDPHDFVVIEIASALTRRIPVIPVLVDRTSLPAANLLPEAIATMKFRQACQLRHDPDFATDVERLIHAIETLLQRAEGSAPGVAART
jgi:hypothetical protein